MGVLPYTTEREGIRMRTKKLGPTTGYSQIHTYFLEVHSGEGGHLDELCMRLEGARTRFHELRLRIAGDPRLRARRAQALQEKSSFWSRYTGVAGFGWTLFDARSGSVGLLSERPTMGIRLVTVAREEKKSVFWDCHTTVAGRGWARGPVHERIDDAREGAHTPMWLVART